VAGALTERDFVTKLQRAGFTDIEIVERTPMSVDDCALYPLFTPDVLNLMRTLIPPQRQQTIGTAIVVRAHLAVAPSVSASAASPPTARSTTPRGRWQTRRP